MSKLFIKNRDNLRILVNIDLPVELHVDLNPHPAKAKGLAFIMPSLGSRHGRQEFVAMSDVLTHYGYIAISFDPTHSFGKSDGDYADATFTTYASDLEDVIEWASKNLPQYTEPFILVGHSLGAMSTVYYAERFPEKVKALAPLATVISGKLSLDARGPEEVEKWKALGYQEQKRSNGDIKILKWSHMEDRLKYDMLMNASKINMPLLMLAGEFDKSTPPNHEQLLFDAVATPVGDKEFHIIKNADHDIGRVDILPVVKEIFEKWLSKLN
ncbi:MAG: alpha/beta fold hydrolase [Candidatus Pacebacteria bacterium]|nr:alpha/beta fold hydrolase [Candidatus Paceibacterota bacterium]